MKITPEQAGIEIIQEIQKGKTLSDARHERQLKETLKAQEKAIENLTETVKDMNTPKKWDIKISRNKKGLIESLTCTEIK